MIVKHQLWFMVHTSFAVLDAPIRPGPAQPVPAQPPRAEVPPVRLLGPQGRVARLVARSRGPREATAPRRRARRRERGGPGRRQPASRGRGGERQGPLPAARVVPVAGRGPLPAARVVPVVRPLGLPHRGLRRPGLHRTIAGSGLVQTAVRPRACATPRGHCAEEPEVL